MLRTLEIDIYYQLSGLVHIICSKLPFAVIFLVKNKNHLIMFSETELIQTNYASSTAISYINVRYFENSR